MDASAAQPWALCSIGENAQHWNKLFGERGVGGVTEERGGDKWASRHPPEA